MRFVRLLRLFNGLHRLRCVTAAGAAGRCDRFFCQYIARHNRDPRAETYGDHEHNDQKDTGFGELHGVTFFKTEMQTLYTTGWKM